jgi:fused signal recognition particle receptor
LSLFLKLKKSRNALAGKLETLFAPGISRETLEEAEEILLGSDLGWELTEKVIDRLRSEASRNRNTDWRHSLAGVLEQVLPEYPPHEPQDVHPRVTMVVGVNGAGKTTTIARLAFELIDSRGRGNVLLACADTYRAAAAKQLCLWGERLGIPVFTGGDGADPGSVAFDAVKKAAASGCTDLIMDTAGRLPTQKGLMDELSKIWRVTGKAMPGAPHEVLLVLDGTVGQNALPQARQFMDAVPVTGIVVTKLDGTAKGGAVFAMAAELGVPIRYVGTGEGRNDLVPFCRRDFVKAIAGIDG